MIVEPLGKQLLEKYLVSFIIFFSSYLTMNLLLLQKQGFCSIVYAVHVVITQVEEVRYILGAEKFNK